MDSKVKATQLGAASELGKAAELEAAEAKQPKAAEAKEFGAAEAKELGAVEAKEFGAAEAKVLGTVEVKEPEAADAKEFETAAELEAVMEKHRAFFEKGGTRSVALRILYLRKLAKVLKQREQDIFAALKADLGKSDFEAYLTELGVVLGEIRYITGHLFKWTKPRRVRTALTHLGSVGRVIPEPYGTVLIIAPWNYPLQLALSPLIGAVAAGNTAVLKPSELAPSVSRVLKSVLEDVFPEDYVSVVEGGPEVSAGLLELPFDYIFFTGSVRIGRIVMEAAAKQLTPVTLELGGKSPGIVHFDANLKLAARRIAFGKFVNAGQTCVASDYVLVHRRVKDRFIAELRAAIQELYGTDALHNEAYGRIVGKRHFDRLLSLLPNTRPVIGGGSDSGRLKIEPTVLELELDKQGLELPVMREEIFGPILPVLAYDELGEVIDTVKGLPKPLALYLFTASKAVQKLITGELSFGGGTINDTLLHMATPYLPFGGVGESGMGSYHGVSSFRTFSHEKSVLKQTTRFDFRFRYPGAKQSLSIIRRLMR